MRVVHTMKLFAVIAMTAAFANDTQAAAGCASCNSNNKQEKKEEVKLQTTCPVMGGKINKSQYVDHDGKRIYVCCMGCIQKIKENPEKYIEKLEKQGVVLDTATEQKKNEPATSIKPK